MAASQVSFVHGVASGDPYADSVILWTRITPPQGTAEGIEVSWEISRSPGFEAAAIVDSGLFSTSTDRDWTVKVEADGLNADTPYYYRFRAGDAVSMVGQTKTLPVGGDPVRLAVFSCANFPAADTFAAYGRASAINAVNPYDALVHLGDYIYEYGPGGYGEAENAAGSRGFLPNREIVSLDDYRQRYAQYHTDANLQALRAAAPLIAIWDDHETANDSWAGGAQNHQSATEGDWLLRRDSALKAYHEWLPIREPELRQASDGATALSPLTQGYRSFNFGDVLALHILETRLTARDQQLSYPNAAAVQARIGVILADPTQLGAYAGRLGLTPPADAAAVPAFAAALAPLVTQELVLATVQQAWADPNRDLIGDTQLSWLQQQLASSTAAWQVLGQQVLMQSMAVPVELLLNAGNPALLDKYAAPLQKLATGTPFASLSPAEQALFAEAGKIPYSLDAWDGYGVERETILQTAMALGKRLISLAGDTHNAWAGVLDTMSAGSKPAGTVAGVEFATPGVTSPGFEKYLPGADAYIRAKYPGVDGLDGLFLGYVNGLKYADLNRRGFLDLTVSKEQAVGSFQFLNGTDPLNGQPLWSSESVVSSASYGLSTTAEARPLITWQPGWRELDLVIGMAVDGEGSSNFLDPAAYASVPRDGIQLADVTVLGSAVADRIYAGVGSTVDAGPGSDELFNTDSLGGNLLVGGIGSDSFFLRPVHDVVIGGSLLADPVSLGLPALIALVDRELDKFVIDSSDPSGEEPLRILDYEQGIDKLLLDGVAPQGDWLSIRKQLQDLNVAINAAPQLSLSTLAISLNSGTETTKDLAPYCTDIDGDNLQLVKLAGPEWITVAGTVLKVTVPAELTEEQLVATNLQLGFSDGKAITSFTPILTLNAPPSKLELANATSSLVENSSTSARIKVADIVITDDALGTETIVLSGADASSFELDGNSLYLKAGTVLNYEAKSAYAVSVAASDSSLPGSTPASANFILSITDVNEAPTALALANATSSLAENSSTSVRVKVADIVITDDALGTETIVLSGADASSFELDGNSLYLKAGTVLNYEAKSAYAVSVSGSDSSLPSSSPVSATFNLSVTDVNEAPTALAFANTTSSLAENSSTSVRIKVADIVVTDDELGTETIVLSGADASSFELDGNNLYLKAGTLLNYEAKSAYAVSVSASDSSLPSSSPASATFTLSVTDVNEAPTALAFANSTSFLAENSNTSARIKVADIVITDDELGTETIVLSGADASSFELDGNSLYLKAGTVLNYEAKSAYAVSVSASDSSLPGSTPVSATFNLSVTDVNEAPTALAIANATSSLAENSSTSVRVKVADIVITDDALGTETIVLSGADASSFELDGNSLYLKAGTVLNYEAKSAYAVSVAASDSSLPGSIPASATFILSVTDVNEVPGTSVVTTIVSITTPAGEIRQIPVTIGGANFSSGSGLTIIPTSEINQESLTTLNQLGVSRNSTGLDFVIDTDPGQSRASLGAQLDLVAADLLPQLSDGSGRLANRKLLYYALNSVTGSTSPLTFDPITGAGARFFDINNDGTPDFFALSLIDGGYGDKDGLTNGRIDDPSFAGFADLTNLSFRSPGSGILTISDPGNTAPVAVSLRANLSGRPSSSNQIGYVVLSPDELPGSANLLNDLTWLRGRAKTLFSSLESTDVTLPANTRFERDILLINGQSLRFFEVQDASLDQLTSLSDSRFRYLNQADLGNTQASFSSSSGVRFSLGVLPGDPGLNALIGQAQAQAPVLDLSALTAAQRLQGTVALAREADFNSVAGFYRSLDAQGTIVAADGVTRLRPGDVGYGAAALRSDNLVNQLGNLSLADDQISSRSFADVTGGTFLAPYVVVNGNTFFAYGAANSDGISHFRSLGNNLFGLEDIAGGGDLDYDDLVIGFNFTSII